MYKRLYLNKEVPVDRRSYNLVTHDIEGAQPRLWNHPQKPFFTKNDAETHLNIQNEQYNAALHENLQYTQKEREPIMKPSRKVGYPNVRAKYSEIGDEHMINGNKDYLPVLQAKQVFFPRNLNVKDIEGTEVGSLNSKFIKNWKLHHEQKDLAHQSERVKVDIDLPYGDGNNREEYMPEHLKHARLMANRNRNKLRVINTVSPMQGGYHSSEKIDRQPQFSQERNQGLPNLSQKQLKQQSIQHQYRDGKEAFNSIRHYSNQSNIYGDEQSDLRDPREEHPRPQAHQSPPPEQANLQTQRPDEYQQYQAKLQEVEDLRQYEEYLRQQNEAFRNDNRYNEESPNPQMDWAQNDAHHTQQQGPPSNTSYQQEPARQPIQNRSEEAGKKVRFEQRDEEYEAQQHRAAAEREWMAENQRRAQSEEAERQMREQESRMIAEQREQQERERAEREEMKARELRETKAHEEQLSEEAKRINLASFMRGKKGHEFSLDQMESNKLKYLNDFYSEYMAEQYKRRLPYTKDEYNYQTAVHHMKRNKIL